MPNTNKDNFNAPPSFVSKVKMKIKPVKVRYLHFTIKFAIDLKNGMAEAYAKNKVMMIDQTIAFNVSARLTSMLSQNNLVVSNCPKAAATLPGLGIKPSEVICHAVIVMMICAMIITTNVCLLMWPNGLKMPKPLPLSPKGGFLVRDALAGTSFLFGLLIVISIVIFFSH